MTEIRAETAVALARSISITYSRCGKPQIERLIVQTCSFCAGRVTAPRRVTSGSGYSLTERGVADMLTGFDLCRAALAVTGISAPEQSVLTVLAIMADENARCWPAVSGPRGLTGKTKLCERAVQNAVKALAAAGHITRAERPGKGVIYTVHPLVADEAGAAGEHPAPLAPRTACAPHEVRPAADAVSPAPHAPKQPRTTIPSKASPSSVKRPTRVAADFVPTPSAGSLTAKAMAGWPPGELEEQVEHFIDHHTTHGTTSLDWQASWRTWVKNWKRFNGNRSRHHDRSEPQNPMVRALRNAEAREAGASSGVVPARLHS